MYQFRGLTVTKKKELEPVSISWKQGSFFGSGGDEKHTYKVYVYTFDNGANILLFCQDTMSPPATIKISENSVETKFNPTYCPSRNMGGGWSKYEDVVGNLKEADILEIDRIKYKHFVMHWGTDKKTNRALCFHVYKGDDGYGKKELAYLDKVVGNDLCRINNLTEEAYYKNLKELPKQVQIDKAKEGLDCQDVTNFGYNALFNNCETYVTELKYGSGFSQQVNGPVEEFFNVFVKPRVYAYLESRFKITAIQF